MLISFILSSARKLSRVCKTVSCIYNQLQLQLTRASESSLRRLNHSFFVFKFTYHFRIWFIFVQQSQWLFTYAFTPVTIFVVYKCLPTVFHFLDPLLLIMCSFVIHTLHCIDYIRVSCTKTESEILDFRCVFEKK